MLALRRSSRETRFLLHDRDAAMIYHSSPRECFFSDESVKALWEQTVKSQAHHPANEEELGSKWNTVLRYSLSVVLGAVGKTLNRKEPADLFRNSFKSLLNLFGHNGFLGNQLNDLTRTPILFEADKDRDAYFHASFEVPLVLMLHGLHDDTSHSHQQPLPQPTARPNPLFDILACFKDISLSLRAKERPVAPIEALNSIQPRRVALVMEENLPFNNHLVSTNVCPINEEWLYNYPSFFFDPDADRVPTGRWLSKPEIFNHDDVGLTSGDTTGDESIVANILDAKKNKGHGKHDKAGSSASGSFELDDLDNATLEQTLENPRRALDAKKRFIYLRNAQAKGASSVFVAGSEAEQEALRLFFRRHFRKETFTSEETDLALNLWNSELHLSFHCLVQDEQSRDTSPTPSKPPKEFKVPNTVQASISYRFHGDIFDRHWTCHLIEFFPRTNASQEDERYNSLSELEMLKPQCVFPKKDADLTMCKAWWQRKILELVLCRRMVHALLTHTELTKQSFDKVLQIDAKDKILSPSGVWVLAQDCAEKLGEIQDNLTQTIQKLKEWNERADRYGKEKPRWTLNDENKYRSTIRKIQSSMIDQGARVSQLRDQVQSAQKKFERAASEIGEKRKAAGVAHSERNIRWFTYVTIVFAPLSFAEGFYSMGGAPSLELVVSLAKFCIAALAVTVSLLICSIKTFSILEKKRSVMLSRGDKVRHGLWGVLFRTVFDHMASGMLFSFAIVVCDDFSGKDVPALIFSLLPGVFMGVAFTVMWAVEFIATALLDCCLALSK